MVRSSFVLALSLAFTACTEGGPAGPVSDVSGTFRITIQTNSGAIVQGTLVLQVAKDSTITGTKSLSLTSGSRSGLEPLFGGGAVRGKISPNRIWLGLNPLYADHNFFLEGDAAPDRLTGQFTHVGFVGAVEQLGTFEAQRQ